MAEPDAKRAAGSAIAVLAAALALLLSAHAAEASCGEGSRVNHRDAECLSANWNNRGVLRKSPDPGVSGLARGARAVTAERCRTRFHRRGMARHSCWNVTADTSIAGETENCVVMAECQRMNPVDILSRHSGITLPFDEVGDLFNCDGILTLGPCPQSWDGQGVLSVSDAETREGPGASLVFMVTLFGIADATVEVDYATANGTASEGTDYSAASGTLTFRRHDVAKAVTVPVLDDGHDEPAETVVLRLSNPRSARIADPEGTGTIVNSDPMPGAWIGRFGRTVANQVLDAVETRMRARPAPGAEAHVAGHRLDLGPLFGAGGNAVPGKAPAREPDTGRPLDEGGPALRDIELRPGSPEPVQAASERLLPGASFSMTAETAGAGLVSIWGRGAATGFSSREDDVAVDGDVASGLLGADWTRGDWTVGLAVSRSRGDGDYRGAGGGKLSATMTGVWPWVRHAPNERLSVWGVAGYGDGSLTLEPRAEDGTHAEAIGTDLDLMMAAAGLRGIAVDGGTDGLTLAVKADAMVVRTASDAASGPGGNLAAAEAGVTRLRLGLEGSRPFRLGDGSTLTPSLEIGLRRDGGDAETGFGADIGAGLAWQDTERGLGAELRGRGLLAHEAKDFRELGLSASFTWDPAAGERGPRLSLTQTVGVAAHGGADALFERTTLAGLAANDYGDEPQLRRLEARLGYGFAAFGDHFTATPEIAVGLSDAGRDYSLGWRLAGDDGTPDGNALELAVEVRRHESTAHDKAPPEHAAAIRATSRF